MTRKEQAVFNNFISDATMKFKTAVYSPEQENADTEKAVLFALMDLRLELDLINNKAGA